MTILIEAIFDLFRLASLQPVHLRAKYFQVACHFLPLTTECLHIGCSHDTLGTRWLNHTCDIYNLTGKLVHLRFHQPTSMLSCKVCWTCIDNLTRQVCDKTNRDSSTICFMKVSLLFSRLDTFWIWSGIDHAVSKPHRTLATFLARRLNKAAPDAQPSGLVPFFWLVLYCADRFPTQIIFSSYCRVWPRQSNIALGNLFKNRTTFRILEIPFSVIDCVSTDMLGFSRFILCRSLAMSAKLIRPDGLRIASLPSLVPLVKQVSQLAADYWHPITLLALHLYAPMSVVLLLTCQLTSASLMSHIRDLLAMISL